MHINIIENELVLIKMKEKVHQGLASLVLREGTVHLNPNLVNQLIYGSIEPDILNKQEIEENIISKPRVLYNWWKDHSLWANNLALAYTEEAQIGYRNNQYNWSQYLGWAFHFITDRATPYHSPNKLVPMINNLKNDYHEGAKSLNGFSRNSQIAGGLLNVGVKILTKGLVLKMDHDDFETYCEQKWNPYKVLTSEIFISLKKYDISKINLGLIEQKLDYLHEKYKDITLEWIKSSINFAKYMAEIAFVMDLAYQFVFK